ncbi:hypothetical protein E7Z59_07655 [Robertkochia marina]|uniref:Dipeptidylpeptidase IV N-terminal domain-containing protein n=1 Tax=Robertkochia marina TaxID=1227945 RepID=A0A4S3M1U1_9FLAO|nr:DPP IV N-terminal domain-containing protein [Robertkochia marina]THD67529.1 hypothetical protein E7Z59_07655 [Robertkochia marina]TRZ44604.1 hypothetical protein D3A96_08295 [Robertkochia marina]
MKKSLTLVFLLFLTICSAQKELLYISTVSGNFDIFKLDLQTGASEQLTDNAGWDWAPKYIPKNGEILYYSTDTTDTFSYRLMDPDGCGVALEAIEGENLTPSPDGKNFTYTSKTGDHQYIFLYDRCTLERKKVVGSKSYNGRVCWKRDGSGFAFISDRDGNNEIYYFELKGKRMLRLTNDEKRQKYMAWSPDGKHLVFSEELSDTANQLKILELATGKITELTGTEYIESELSWSPDGQHIAFHSKRDQGDQLYMIHVETKKVRQLTFARAYHGEPEWIND